jgi:hypothetical protein
MSFEERQTWVEAVVMIVVPGWYFVTILSQASSTPISDIEYQWPLAISVVVVIATIIVGIIATTIGAAIGNRIAIAREAGTTEGIEFDDSDLDDLDRSDERDKAINRFGGYVGGIVLGVAVLVPLGLAMAEREPFWIANALYAALVLSILASSAVKLVAYRRGF